MTAPSFTCVKLQRLPAACSHARSTRGTSRGVKHPQLFRTPSARNTYAAPRSLTTVRGFGNEVVEGFFDLAKLVASDGGKKKTIYEDLAYQIGRDVYVDVNNWHLYMKDISATPSYKMSQVLAEQIGSTIQAKGYSERDIEDLLKKIPLKLGGGRVQLPLADVIPSRGIQDLQKIAEDYARNL